MVLRAGKGQNPHPRLRGEAAVTESWLKPPPKSSLRSIDESSGSLIVATRRGAFTAESPDRKIDSGDPWNLIRLTPA
jgi:hypothetical protein